MTMQFDIKFATRKKSRPFGMKVSRVLAKRCTSLLLHCTKAQCIERAWKKTKLENRLKVVSTLFRRKIRITLDCNFPNTKESFHDVITFLQKKANCCWYFDDNTLIMTQIMTCQRKRNWIHKIQRLVKLSVWVRKAKFWCTIDRSKEGIITYDVNSYI